MQGQGSAVQAHPGMVTRIIAKFEGFPGKYVWHCHILEREDNEMMRPYEVVTWVGASSSSRHFWRGRAGSPQSNTTVLLP